ncbi:MAG: single-stranded DNA-binding protein [Oscillospiraceae bacterium]
MQLAVFLYAGVAKRSICEFFRACELTVFCFLETSVRLQKGAGAEGGIVMNLNQITIVGYVTRDAEVTTTKSGKEVTNFTVAVKQGSDQPVADFFSVECWGMSWAKDVASKGSLVLVQGSMRSKKGSDGKIYWHINADKVLLMKRKDNGAQNNRKAKDKNYPPLYDGIDYEEQCCEG